MLYPAVLESTLLKPATRRLTYTAASGETPASGARVEVLELAEALLGAVAPAYTGVQGTSAARILAMEVNHLVDMGVVTGNASALVVKSLTRGARSESNQEGVALVPDEIRKLWDGLVALPETPGTTTLDRTPARYLHVRSRR